MNRPLIHLPAAPLPGMDSYGFHQTFRIGTCEEFGCEWFLYGKAGEDDGAPFVHPAGVECGDYTRCQPCSTNRRRPCGTCIPCQVGTANCPCPSRLNAYRTSDGRRGHPVPAFEVMPVLSISDLAVDRLRSQRMVRSRPVDVPEFTDRLGEGVEMIRHIRTRGL